MRRLPFPLLALLLVVGIAALLLAAACGGGQTITAPSLVSSLASSSSTTTGTSTSTAPFVQLTPYSTTLGAGETQKFAASLSDASATPFTWTLTDCTDNCGTIASDGLYTAPSFVAKNHNVTIRATSQSKSAMVGIAYVTLEAVSVAISPASLSRLPANSTRPFGAATKYDPLTQGVSWTLSGTGCTGNSCGTLTDATPTSVVYHAPSATPASVMLTAISITDPNQSASISILVMGSASQFQLQGTYAFLIHGTRSPEVAGDYANGGEMAIAGHIAIDASGNLSGIWDATLKASGGTTEPISGNYVTSSDGIGTITLHASSGTWTLALAAQPGGDSAALWQDPDQPPPLSTIAIQSGYLLRQDTSAFSMSSVAGDRVLALTFMNVGALGRLTADAAGTISNGQMDLTWQAEWLNFFTTSTLTGSFAAPDPLTGRGTAALTTNPGPDTSPETFHFAYYIVSAKKMLLVQSDTNTWQWPVLRGEARYQSGAGTFTNASWNSPVIYNLTSDDAGSWFTPFATLGVIRPDGSGSLSETSDNTEQVEDVGTVVTLQASDSGTYSVSPYGRVGLSVPGVTLNLYNPHVGVAYLTGLNEGYLIREQIFGTPFGYFEPQDSTARTSSGWAGTYNASLAGPPRTFKSEKDIGMATLNDNGTTAIMLALDRGAGFEVLNWAGTYTISDNGHGVMNLTDASGKPKSIVFWAVTANRLVAILSMSADDQFPTLITLSR